MIKLSVSIMHCSWNKSRVDMLKIIESKINKSLLNGFQISDDVNKNGIWWNCKEAWKMVPEDSTHHIVLQDDMIPCDNFIETLLELINKNSDNIIHIFGTNECSDIFYKKNHRWFKSRDGAWGGSVILPKNHFYWYKKCDKIIKDKPKLWDDTRFNFYCLFYSHDIWHVTPTLLIHKGYDTSLVGNPTADFRIENCFVKGNPLDIDWSIQENVENGMVFKNMITYCYHSLKDEFKRQFLNTMKARTLADLQAIERKSIFKGI